ncbi:zinc finger protein 282-like isoform X5 [Bufo gargarizans]|uniref:zinc finger protein 282-like isoform X5 n=1 Tax=Bufo gargarizans TaxID=30331 RepID=UPI001CF2D59A|nr:zinc finger protein 282-like isoform X5 [Bufo gargarizans]
MMVLSINDPPRMDQNRYLMATRILDLTLEIISLITGEDYTVVKKSSDKCVTPRVSGGRSRTQSPITEPPPHSLIHEQKILELTNRITDLLTGEVPVRCQDVAVYFSIEEWEYLEGHKDQYKDVMMDSHQTLTSLDGSSQRYSPERFPSPLYSQDCPDEKLNVPLDHQDVLTENHQILTSLDGSSQRNPPERCRSPLCPQDCPEEKPNVLLVHQDVLTDNHQILTSLDGSSQRNPTERCPSPLCPQDCPEEKQNVPLDYQDVIMENNQPLTSLDGSMQKNPPERCPSPLYSQDCPEEKPNFALDYHELKIENHQTLISLDGSSQRNPPERCPSPLYSQDCPEEKQNVLLYDLESDGSGRTSGLENPTSVTDGGDVYGVDPG